MVQDEVVTLVVLLVVLFWFGGGSAIELWERQNKKKRLRAVSKWQSFVCGLLWRLAWWVAFFAPVGLVLYTPTPFNAIFATYVLLSLFWLVLGWVWYRRRILPERTALAICAGGGFFAFVMLLLAIFV